MMNGFHHPFRIHETGTKARDRLVISTHYTAFISYRHMTPDQEIAKKLHRMIESYSVPSALREEGRRHVGKVFRDQEELPLSSDLGKDIEDALDNSEWLICVCSPAYLESRWCLRELEYFMEHRDRNHVLVLLTKGEPQDSFPEPLRFTADDAGNRIELEPLAADVRGNSLAESLKKLKREKFRILAPILGTTFDGLYQRQRRQTMRNVLAAALSAVVILGGFLAYALAQNQRITEQNEQISAQNTELTEKNEQIAEQNVRIGEERAAAARNECDLLVEKSIYYSSVNRKKEAVGLGLEAKAVSETVDGYARENIREALAVACSMGDFAVEAELDFPGLVNYNPSCCFSPDGSVLAVVDSRSGLSLCDTATGERLWVSSPFSHDITSVHWKEDSSMLVVTARAGHTVCLVDAATGEHVKEVYLPWACNAIFEGDNVLVAFSQGIVIWETDGNGENFPYVIQIDEDQYSTSKSLLNDRFISLCQGISLSRPRIWFKEKGMKGYSWIELESSKAINGYTLSPDGEWVFVHQSDQCLVINLRTDEIRWTVSGESGIFINEDCGPVWSGNIILDCGKAYDAATGEVLYETENQKYVGVSADGQYFADAGAFYRLSDGEWFANVPGTLKAIDPTGKHLVVYRTLEYGSGVPGNPDAVISRRQAAYLEMYPGNGSQYTVEKYEGSLLDIPDWTDPKMEDGNILMLNDPYGTSAMGYIMSKSFFSPDTRFYIILNQGAYIPVYDLEKGQEPAHRIYDFSVGDPVEAVDIGFSADSRRMAVAGNAGHVAVYDLESGSMIQSFTDTYLALSLSGVKFNRSGDYLMVADYSLRSFRIYSVSNGQTVYIMHAVRDTESWGFDEKTGDAVVKYKDGGALIAHMFEDEEALFDYAREITR